MGRHPGLTFMSAAPADPDKRDLLTDQDIAEAERTAVVFLGMRDDPEQL
jgi:hypothetical protein